MAQRITHDVMLARIDERLVSLRTEMDKELKELKEQNHVMDRRLKNLEEVATKYKGGFALVLGVGAVIGFLVSIWDKIMWPK